MKSKLIAQGAEKSKICAPSNLLAQGAEAKILLSKGLGGREKIIIKDRIKKSYRIPELDDKIRKQRTKAETKLLFKANQIINTPKPFEDNSKYQIKMPFIYGKKLSEYLDKFSLKKQKQISKKIGEAIAKIHDADIIHGDLTTSNMILVEKLPTHKSSQINKNFINDKSSLGIGAGDVVDKSDKPIIFFIDFGLGYFNGKYEDKAVDLHLLKQALEAKHFKHSQVLWKNVEEGYKSYKDSKKVLERLIAVEKRGRYKK